MSQQRLYLEKKEEIHPKIKIGKTVKMFFSLTSSITKKSANFQLEKITAMLLRADSMFEFRRRELL